MNDYFRTNDIGLLVTNPHENDAAVRDAAGDGEVRCFKLPHVAMCDDFNELKKLQLLMRDADLFEQDISYIAIDISEWLGSQLDEYFIVTLKFLCDHTYKWRYVFTVDSQKPEREVKAIYATIKCYLKKGFMREDESLKSKDNLQNFLRNEYAFEESTADILAEILFDKKYAPYLSRSFVETITGELKDFSGDSDLTPDDVRKYISDGNSILNIIGGETVAERYAAMKGGENHDSELQI
jgi:hypothetical protein